MMRLGSVDGWFYVAMTPEDLGGSIFLLYQPPDGEPITEILIHDPCSPCGIAALRAPAIYGAAPHGELAYRTVASHS